jgi:proteasome accessory factor C
MAKDTEKLIRQLSLISYLMAERRPVTALEIRRDVEGYSGMNEDAFARRFYADRSELESLRIQLTVERPADGAAEQENYSLRPENFHLPPIAFSEEELAALQTALSLLDGEFAYAEPLRLALQQITWGRPSPLRAPEQRSVALGITASAGGHELSARLAKVETAIFRNKTILFEYYTMERDATGARRVDPYHLLFQGGQFYLLGYSHEREAIRVFRLSRIRGKVSYATKAEHDFRRPAEFDPRAYANRADWQLGEERAVAEILISERIAWQVERHFGRYGEIVEGDDGAVLFRTGYSNQRGLISWVFGLGVNARLQGPAELTSEVARRLKLLKERHGRVLPGADAEATRRHASSGGRWRGRAGSAGSGDSPRALRASGDAREHLDPRRARGRARADRGGARAAAAQRGGVAGGRQRAQRRQLRGRLVRALRGDRRAGG